MPFPAVVGYADRRLTESPGRENQNQDEHQTGVLSVSAFHSGCIALELRLEKMKTKICSLPTILQPLIIRSLYMVPRLGMTEAKRESGRSCIEAGAAPATVSREYLAQAVHWFLELGRTARYAKRQARRPAMYLRNESSGGVS